MKLVCLIFECWGWQNKEERKGRRNSIINVNLCLVKKLISIIMRMTKASGDEWVIRDNVLSRHTYLGLKSFHTFFVLVWFASSLDYYWIISWDTQKNTSTTEKSIREYHKRDYGLIVSLFSSDDDEFTSLIWSSFERGNLYEFMIKSWRRIFDACRALDEGVAGEQDNEANYLCSLKCLLCLLNYIRTKEISPDIHNWIKTERNFHREPQKDIENPRSYLRNVKLVMKIIRPILIAS